MQSYKRALERGFILSPKQATLERHGLLEWWESVKACNYEGLRIQDEGAFRELAIAKETRRSPLYSSSVREASS